MSKNARPFDLLHSAFRWLKCHLTWVEGMVFLLVLNIFLLAALLWKVEANPPLEIATVSVTQLSRLYSQQFAADPANTPEMIRRKTGIFIATTEKLLGEAVQRRRMLVLARECVLTGDNIDLTPQVAQSVDAALKSGLPMNTEAGHAPALAGQ